MFQRYTIPLVLKQAAMGGMALAAGFLCTIGVLDHRQPIKPELSQFEAFSSLTDGPRLLNRGWSKPERWGTWTESTHAELDWALDRNPASDVHVSLKGYIYPRRANIDQAIRVIVNNTPVAVVKRNFQGELFGRNFSIPRSVAIAKNPMRIEFVVENPVSPRSIGDGEDGRQLGLGLESIELAYQDR